MYKIVDQFKDSLKVSETDIFDRSNLVDIGTNSYTDPHTSLLDDISFSVIKNIPRGIKEVSRLTGDTATEAVGGESNLEALLTPPNEMYSDIIPPEGISTAQQVENLVLKQFVQQFYEVYIVPVGSKDVYNRLGQIAGNVADVHSLYPNGLKGLVAADSQGSWRTNLNYSFTIDEGVSGVSPVKYSSLGFPPFISHETININNLKDTVVSADTIEENAKSSYFDMDNILFRRNAATYRYPAFKQVNDNIHLLQVFLNRCFGIESTYINEWDLSLYMQEGLCSFLEKEDTNGDTVRVPQMVTTLTYGLLDDAPIEIIKDKGKDESLEDIDLDKVSTFASLNLAVSTRYGIDNQPIGQQANTTEYVISAYPYSAYWYPWDSGATVVDLNVSNYIDTMFAYRISGLPFNDKEKTESAYSKNYTPAVYHGKDLAKSTKRFLNILNYEDNRHAVLSGWNGTDVQGKYYLSEGDRTNESTRSNAYSYLPYWKQFYTISEDGMSDVDLYMQEVIASDRETSILNAAYHIIGAITADNDPFNEMCEAANRKNYNITVAEVKEGSDAVDNNVNLVIPSNYGVSTSYKDMSFSLFKCKLKIPGSKLLNMFLNKSSVTSKAMSAANGASGGGFGVNVGNGTANNNNSSSAGGITTSPVNALKNATPTKILNEPEKTIIDGQEVDVTEYAIEDKDDLASIKTVGDGIAEYSPFLFGGPHGKYYSPLTLEGYTQYNNQSLANVPTVDIYSVFTGAQDRIGLRGFEYSKNFKLNGSYIDTVICLTPNEREALVQGASPFGVKDMKPDTRHLMSYTSNPFIREYFTDWWMYWTIRIFRWRIRIPKFRYWKIARINNGWRQSWVWKTNNYGTVAYVHRHHTSRWEDDVSVQPDWWNTDFKLLPTCGWINSFSESVYNGDAAWQAGDAVNHIRHDQNRFRQPTTWTISDGKIVYTYKASTDKIGSDCVKWMIIPANTDPSITCGLNYRQVWIHYATYGASGTKWGNQLQNLYNAGTREMSVTLPIKDSNNNILELVCGVANIYKSSVTIWKWILHARYHYYYRHWWGGWSYWGRHSYNSRRWWGCWHWRRCVHYYWVFTKITTDVFNMYFRPNKVQWALPTDHLINREAKYTDQRDSSSSNIIKRYNTDGADDSRSYRFSHISSTEAHSPKLFPFTEEFINKYGIYEPRTIIPGVTSGPHVRYMNSLKVLHTKGFYYGNILESYKEKGYVESITAVKPYHKQWYGDISYWDTASGVRYNMRYGIPINARAVVNYIANIFRFFFGRFYEKKSTFNVQRTVLWTADTPIYIVDQTQKQPELTSIFDNCQRYSSIQEYQEGDVPFMTWYKTKDTMSVYIDIASQQIAWLKQLRDYADTYLTDQLIYDVYKKSVNNKTQAIIEHNYNGDVKVVNGEPKGYIDCGGWTDSFTEDIDYSDALAIVRRVFNTVDSSKNTIYDLTEKRIERLTSLKEAAIEIRNNFETAPTVYMHKFMRLVTNTKSFLDGAITDGVNAEDTMFDVDTGKYIDQLFEVKDNGATVFNTLKNPAAVLWAYINVLYHVRKYWVDLRLNKRAGSYWQLRGLERVLVYMLSQSKASDNPQTVDKSIPQGISEELKTKSIMYVQPRTSFKERVDEASEINTVNTQAVYVKVNYLNTPNPKNTSLWNNDTQRYDGDEIVYVNETYRHARKPQDGLYYVMSEAINNSVSEFSKELKNITSQITAKEYKITQDDYDTIVKLLNPAETSSIKYSTDKVDESGNRVYDTYTFENSAILKYLALMNVVGKSISDVNDYIDANLKNEDISTTALGNIFKIFINKLALYKRDYYLEKMYELLYPVYIRWQPQQVWTGTGEDDVNGAWHIDEWQKKDTNGKERSVKDLYGYIHTSSEAISAGITFGVSASLNPDTILNSPTALRGSSLLEILCSSIDTIDLWRIEIPANMNIPTTLLEKKPVLVPAYQIDAAVNGLKAKEVVKSEKSVLVGVSTNSMSPVLEATEDMLTINTLSALGEFSSLSDVGINTDSIVNSGN